MSLGLKAVKVLRADGSEFVSFGVQLPSYAVVPTVDELTPRAAAATPQTMQEHASDVPVSNKWNATLAFEHHQCMVSVLHLGVLLNSRESRNKQVYRFYSQRFRTIGDILH